MFIDRCSAVQFPVESSIPAMLVEYAITSDAAIMLQSVPQVLQVYDDSMVVALHRLQRPYLFDELEAELNVVVRNMISKLTVMVYRYALVVCWLPVWTVACWSPFCFRLSPPPNITVL